MTNVLVVEDDRAIARVLELRLANSGYDVTLAHDATTAATVASHCSPQIALLDISMPGGDGFEVAECLRTLYGDRIDLIFLTASHREDVRRRAISYGPMAYFAKPFSAEELLATLAGAV